MLFSSRSFTSSGKPVMKTVRTSSATAKSKGRQAEERLWAAAGGAGVTPLLARRLQRAAARASQPCQPSQSLLVSLPRALQGWQAHQELGGIGGACGGVG